MMHRLNSANESMHFQVYGNVLPLFHMFKESFEIILYNSGKPATDPQNNLNYEPG